MKTCPKCVADIPDGAEVCHSCGNRVVGKPCPDCAELARHAANQCPHCGHSFAREQKIATVEAYTAKAAQLPTLLLRGRLIPQEIHLSSEKIVIQTWGLFWLSRTTKRSRGRRSPAITTTQDCSGTASRSRRAGRRRTDIGCLPKASGLKVKEILERMKV